MMKATISDVHSLFFNGTLMRDECRFHVIEKYKPECILLAEAPGSLLDLGAYPGMIPPLDANCHVQGEFMRFRPEVMEDLLKELDLIEVFRGLGQPGSLYSRVLTDVHVGDGRVRQAWTYQWAGDPSSAPIIVSGDWRAHRGKRTSFLEKLVQAHTGGNDLEAATYLADRAAWTGTPEEHARLLKELDSLAAALERGRISERLLAKATQKWAVIPE